MKTILIISPHFPPSNLAAVHRSRLFAQHLPSYGWKPIVLTVHEDYYEEKLDHNLQKLLPEGLRIEKVKALKVTQPRLIGDIGLRAFFQLYRSAKKIILREKVDFLYIPIPSFYVALLGRMLHGSTGVQYGIDYIDPWVHKFAGSEKIFSRHWFATRLSSILEPIAVKKTALITGVAEGYYSGVKERNPHLTKTALFGAMPYGGEKTDHDKLCQLDLKPYLFQKNPARIQLVYAGAMLPKAYSPLESIFKAISVNPGQFEQLEIHFIGTGKLANDAESFNIRPLAIKYNLWQSVVFEYPKRIPYLDVLIHLNSADGVFILGSTEPHYTPSKVYQGVLSERPIFAILHQDSTAVKILADSGAGIVLSFDGEQGLTNIFENFEGKFGAFKTFTKVYDPKKLNMEAFEQYSARAVTQKLADLINKIATR